MSETRLRVQPEECRARDAGDARQGVGEAARSCPLCGRICSPPAGLRECRPQLLGRLPPAHGLTERPLLVVAAGNLQAVDLHHPAALGLRFGRVVDGSSTKPRRRCREASSSSLSMPSTARAACSLAVTTLLWEFALSLDAATLYAVDLVDLPSPLQSFCAAGESASTLSITGKSFGPSPNFRPKTPVIPCSASCWWTGLFQGKVTPHGRSQGPP